MAAKVFDIFEIPSGRYCLVPENVMPDLMLAANAIELLDVDPRVAQTLAFLLRFYRFKTDLSKSKLAIEVGLSRHTIRQIEEPDHPTDKDTLIALSKYYTKKFGPSFNEALIKLGIKIDI